MKNLAKQIAKQVGREPLEILKTAGRQVGGVEKPVETASQRETGETAIPPTQEYKQKKEAQAQRLMEALRTELSEIKQNEEQEKKEDVQTGQVQEQQEKEAEAQKPVPQISTKPSRRFGLGRKQAAQRETTHIEKPVQSTP